MKAFWIRPLFADRAISGVYQCLVLKMKGIDKFFWVCSYVTGLIWPFNRTYKAYDYETLCSESTHTISWTFSSFTKVIIILYHNWKLNIDMIEIVVKKKKKSI